ncbi:MAG: aldolase, partial [Planctomycetes bacterium]|nr:aldolase [Planctomycetota bacterium]
MSIKERIAAGERVAGVMLRIVRNPAVAYLAKNAGLDFFRFDCEHSSFTLETLHDTFLTANARGVTGLLRV